MVSSKHTHPQQNLCLPQQNLCLTFLQLPPVCFCTGVPKGFACGNCHISTSPHFKAAITAGHCHRLSVSMRHARDQPYAAFLDNIRVNTITEAELAEALPPSLHITRAGAIQQCATSPDTTILCTHVDDTAAYNQDILLKQRELKKVEELHNTPLETDATAIPQLQEWVANPADFTLKMVAVGARVMVTHNLDLSKAAANGAAGVVTHIIHAKSRYTGHMVPSVLTVRLDIGGRDIRVRRTAVYVRFYDGKAYRKCAFPLMLSYAITGHKSQGATLTGPTIVHARDVFACGLLYVMLSRVTTRDNLRIVPPLSAADFLPLRVAPRNQANFHTTIPPS